MGNDICNFLQSSDYIQAGADLGILREGSGPEFFKGG